MTALLMTDLHLTDNARDRHRFDLFPWVRQQIEKYHISDAYILGDLTDAKDRHSAQLVNRFADEISKIAALCSIHIIPGNHDGVNANCPFFKFFDHIQRVTFYLQPGSHDAFLMLPHTKNYEQDWADIRKLVFPSIKYILTHQTYEGAKAENGQALRGIPPNFFKWFKGTVFSGDVHVPQRVGKNIEYVGCPYRIHFGDTFKPRVIVIPRRGEPTDLHPPIPSRELVTLFSGRELAELDFPKKTQLKVRVRLKRSEYPEWPALRREVVELCADHGWELCGVEMVPLKSADRKRDDEPEIDLGILTPEDRVRDYARAKKLNKGMTKLGIKLLRDAQ